MTESNLDSVLTAKAPHSKLLLRSSSVVNRSRSNVNGLDLWQISEQCVLTVSVLSQCLLGYWSWVLGLEWIGILTNNFRQHECLVI